MLQSSENSFNKAGSPAVNPNAYNPVKTVTAPVDQATIGRNGKVDASIQAREVVVMGKVTGNIECSDRVDIRAEGSVAGDISTVRISVEDGASLKGGIQVRNEGKQNSQPNQSKPAEAPKALAATASA